MKEHVVIAPHISLPIDSVIGLTEKQAKRRLFALELISKDKDFDIYKVVLPFHFKATETFMMDPAMKLNPAQVSIVKSEAEVTAEQGAAEAEKEAAKAAELAATDPIEKMGKEELHATLKERDIAFQSNTGEPKLREKLRSAIEAEDEEFATAIKEAIAGLSPEDYNEDGTPGLEAINALLDGEITQDELDAYLAAEAKGAEEG